MKTIWRYELDVLPRQLVQMPLDARVIGAGVQNEFPCVYAELEREDAHKVGERVFSIVTTGEYFEAALQSGYRIVGTVSIKEWYVAHIIEGGVKILGRKSSDMGEIAAELKHGLAD